MPCPTSVTQTPTSSSVWRGPPREGAGALCPYTALNARRRCMDAWAQPSAPFAGAGPHSHQIWQLLSWCRSTPVAAVTHAASRSIAIGKGRSTHRTVRSGFTFGASGSVRPPQLRQLVQCRGHIESPRILRGASNPLNERRIASQCSLLAAADENKRSERPRRCPTGWRPSASDNRALSRDSPIIRDRRQ